MAEPGREVATAWRGTTVRAWLPEPLRRRSPSLSESTIRATEQAAAAARAITARIPTGFEPLARLLLRAEGLASSHIEGVRAPIEDVVLAEAGPARGSAAHVADNLRIVEEALSHANGTEALSADLMHGWHRHLMAHGSLPGDHVGRWRTQVGWIGGASPMQAAFVPAPPEAIDALMIDLVETSNGCPWDPVTTAALVHAQFETIHPYADGNGRVGRVVALWLLVRHLEGVSVPPPISVLIAHDTDAYISALGAFRISMDEHLIGWFASVLDSACRSSLEWAERLGTLVRDWEKRVSGLRADSAGRRIVPLLARFPVLSADLVSEHLRVTLPAARSGLRALVEQGVMEDRGTVASGRGRPRRWWAAPELLDLVQAWAI